MTATVGTTEANCPAWCARRHGRHDVGDEEQLHVSGALQVRRTLLRLVSTVETVAGIQGGPYVVVGEQDYTLHEAEVLIAALTQLVDEARAATGPGVPRMRKPGP
ncbi:hypothetical protein [Nocardioides iriomotensis]|uniref:Uncharacterized protein n=1 Tax=Nocardioides iriomotensis TaxID=715784 RepID=A0A4Q5IUM7_9ACTN|nr:hypothetical protein [Nocardioides iriomotensis]RYU09637.1 hypothetical protein ETU37_21645 [Nocardioides iriomotensis]